MNNVLNKFILLILLCLTSYNTIGQIKVSPMGIDRFNDAPFEYKGERVIMGERVDTELSKNIFLFTKSHQDSIPDTLFAQQFQKTDSIWTLTKDTTIISDETIILWVNRKAFFDQDSIPIAVFSYAIGNTNNDIRTSVNMLAFYLGNIYSLTEYLNQDSSIPSRNFIDLPSQIKNKLFDFWNKLDRWKKD